MDVAKYHSGPAIKLIPEFSDGDSRESPTQFDKQMAKAWTIPERDDQAYRIETVLAKLGC